MGSVSLSNGRDSSGSWPRRTHWCLRHLQRARKSSCRKDVSERAGKGWCGRGSMLNPNSPPSRVRDRQHRRSQGSPWIEAEAAGVAQSRAVGGGGLKGQQKLRESWTWIRDSAPTSHLE